MSTNSIPITINGIRFRSLIEARWAEMFSKLGWDWEYEPIELKGYIPDFIIKFPNRHMLVEVKGETDMKNIEQYADKILNSGWDGEFLIVCSSLEWLNLDELIEPKKNHLILCIGLLGSTKAYYSYGGDPDFDNKPYLPSVKNKDFANLSICEDCKNYTIFNASCGLYWCRYCSSSPCLRKTMISKNDDKIINFWNEAKNSLQWKPK